MAMWGVPSAELRQVGHGALGHGTPGHGKPSTVLRPCGVTSVPSLWPFTADLRNYVYEVVEKYLSPPLRLVLVECWSGTINIQ